MKPLCATSVCTIFSGASNKRLSNSYLCTSICTSLAKLTRWRMQLLASALPKLCPQRYLDTFDNHLYLYPFSGSFALKPVVVPGQAPVVGPGSPFCLRALPLASLLPFCMGRGSWCLLWVTIAQSYRVRLSSGAAPLDFPGFGVLTPLPAASFFEACVGDVERGIGSSKRTRQAGEGGRSPQVTRQAAPAHHHPPRPKQTD